MSNTILAVTQEEVSIGRDLSNQLSINDISVSRRRCLIRKEDSGYKLVDLDSHNGTFINDKPTKERFLEHGDQIKIGNSLFLFLIDEIDALQTSNEIQLEDGVLITKTAVKLRIEDALFLMARDLSALMSISTVINSIRGLEALQRELLEQILEIVPAERGAILLVGEGPDEISFVCGLDRSAGINQAVRVSRTIAQQVLHESVAVLSNDVLESDKFSAAQSLVASQIKSLLCVPLVLLEKMLGIIYLDSTNPAVRFDKDNLQLVTAIANIAAGVLANARHIEWLEGENQRLRTDLNIEQDMVGESPPMQDVYQIIGKVAPSDTNVLINGESGTGKELAARAIHQNCPRAAKPFVAVNCAALTEPLLESELFGHEKGAFTGAFAQKKGKLEVANGGTVFLDEVGEMVPVIQAKLLRVLQEREFERVGGTRPIKANIRLIAATNKNLEERSSRGHSAKNSTTGSTLSRL